MDMVAGHTIDPNSSFGIGFNRLFFGGTTLNAIPTATAFGEGNHSQLLRFFTIPATLFVLLFLANNLALTRALFSGTTTIFFLVFSLVNLLAAYHLYSTMARRERIPFLLARPKRKEFILLVDDILRNKEFAKLKSFYHHTDHIYDHVIRVSYISYAIAKALGLDYRSAARGGLLHDFFLYDWRERKANDSSKSLHGKEHPFIALENARRQFEVSELEADIIVKHMFPKTHALPRYKESFVVSLSDKISATYEYYALLKNRVVLHFKTKA
ncbi:HD domain-containing protein [Sphaerochaeta sp. PS]|uniref:HD domain-containing protein n=1 Tax=Sphaerochaeta sp. PS TaxID=3076336 RepID=UPI0028A52ED7|nr:HD domain-containing protein [Sphaerochaeta sp. PS]MDT4762387.1 HD domain-containing protein [Sphaerochaeta sp. PS]